MKLAEVVWEDSHVKHGWHDSLSLEPALMFTWGEVVRDDEAAVSLLSGRWAEPDEKASDCYDCLVCIPRSAVRRVRYLKYD